MEEENQVFGKNADAVGNNNNLESEDFYFYCQNKEEAKKNIDSSAADISDFIDSLIQDVPAPSEDEVSAGIEKILARTHPEEVKGKSGKGKKATVKVLFIAALLSVLAFSGVYVVGNSNNISIENGFVSFAKDTVKIVFFGEKQEEYITVDALLADLEAHGFGDVLFPQEFVTNADEFKVSAPEYLGDDLRQVVFDIYGDSSKYTVGVYLYDQIQKAYDFDSVKTAESIRINNTDVYLFEFTTGISAIEFTFGEFHYSIHSYAPYSEIVEIANTLK